MYRCHESLAASLLICRAGAVAMSQIAVGRFWIMNFCLMPMLFDLFLAAMLSGCAGWICAAGFRLIPCILPMGVGVAARFGCCNGRSTTTSIMVFLMPCKPLIMLNHDCCV
ncbi:hypothetical protein Nepgr_025997 [Nepenthes gracilis]|uniref:Uncharacterized protein n=1 Tax=Nepenthes gracilis TaxID=150966 RepID=A0AAD3T819_NEPGR|nr:hypothetical protein Nepgr_025997 [Nepenthes gracilis]